MKRNILTLIVTTLIFISLVAGLLITNSSSTSTTDTETNTGVTSSLKETNSTDNTILNKTSTKDISTSRETTAETTTETTKKLQVSPESETITGDTFTGRPALKPIKYSVPDPLNTKGLSTDRIGFSFGVAKNGQPSSTTVSNQSAFDSYNTGAFSWDNKSSDKVLYLTFDCGYEYQNLTSDILNTLRAKKVKAAFFCTLHYLESVPDTVSRIINEGHIVGNHTAHHPSDCSALTRTELTDEIMELHNYLRVNFGYDSKFFRFPAGVYSENALELVHSLGYRSVFWSIAHTDWDPDNQPGVEVSFQTVTSRLHPGAVILLHATSPDNARMLGDLIDYARSQGYEFRGLDEYK